MRKNLFWFAVFEVSVGSLALGPVVWQHTMAGSTWQSKTTRLMARTQKRKRKRLSPIIPLQRCDSNDLNLPSRSFLLKFLSLPHSTKMGTKSLVHGPFQNNSDSELRALEKMELYVWSSAVIIQGGLSSSLVQCY